MRIVLLIVGVLALLGGLATLVAAQSAIHQILGGQGIIGGLTLMALGSLIGAVERGADRIVKALDAGPTDPRA